MVTQRSVFSKNIFISVFLLLAMYQPVAGQTKRALIIAIGNYPEPGKNGWRPIHALNDVPLIRMALLKQQFDPSHITLLTDSMATRNGIEKALDQLVQNSRSGDVVVVHISAHGQQIEDDNISEELDGLDECIVPYGAVYSSDKSIYSTVADGYFRDDQFGEYVTRLRNKLGKNGDLLVILDACHSGTATRSAVSLARGSNNPMVSSQFEKKKKAANDAATVFTEDAPRTKLNKNDAASYVVISGSQAKELNYECTDEEKKPVGSLSYAFSKSLANLRDQQSYRSLFASIEAVMRGKAPRQKPVLEGDGIDRQLFGGNFTPQQPYFTIAPGKSNDSVIVLNGGTVSGVTVESTVQFYPAGTSDPAGKIPLGKGIVYEAGNFLAAVRPDSVAGTLLKQMPWAFVTETKYGTEKIKLKTDDLPESERMLIRTALADLSFIELHSAGELSLEKNQEGNNWLLLFSNSGEIFATVPDLADVQTLKEILKRYDRMKYLRDLHFSETGLTANVDFVFTDETGKPDTAISMSRLTMGRTELREGDVVYLRITNTGSKNFYINIVDIQPDGVINPVLPNNRLTDINNNPAPITWDRCLVKKGQSLFLKDLAITVAPPFGEEIFKVFLSTEPLDLEEILTANTQGNSRSRGVLNNLAKIFGYSSAGQNGTRGNEGKINTAENGTVFSKNFSIVPAQK